METPNRNSTASTSSALTTSPVTASVSDYDKEQYNRDRRIAFYTGEQRHAENYQLQRRNEARAEAAESRAIQAHRMAIRADQRANEQWWEQQQERLYQHAMQERAEARSMEAHEWHRESHALQMQREQERLEGERRARQQAEAQFRNPRASGVMGNARFGTINDAQVFDLLDTRGLFLGTLEGEGLHYRGRAHLTTYAPTQAGKGRNVILQNLAHVDGYQDQRSIVTVDVKNGENAYASALHRMRNIGDRVVTLNPCGLVGALKTRVNPLDRVAMAPKNEIFDRAASIAHVLVPTKPNDKDQWVTQGAQLILQTVIAHYASTDPARCTLANLWRFVMQSVSGIKAALKKMEKSELTAVAGYAAQFGSIMEAQSQWAAYHAEMSSALAAFEPDGPYAKATEVSDWDARCLTDSPHSVYLMMRGGDLENKGRWVSLMLNHMIETAAETPGPYRPLFLLDEFTQLPPIPAVMKALNLYSGLGIQLWFFAQDRKSIAALYGEDGAARIEAQSAVMQAWSFRDISLMRDIEYWAGKTSVKVINATMSDGAQVGTGLSLNEQARPLLQAEDMRNLADDEQFIFLQRGPVFKASLQPWDSTEDHGEVLNDPRQVLKGARLPPAEDESVWCLPDYVPSDLHMPRDKYCPVEFIEAASATPKGESAP